MNNYLEYQINKLIKHINENNLGFGTKLNPERNFSGKYISGEPFDYIIITPANTFCFDAKETKQKSWNLLKKDKKQVHTLLKIKQNTNCKCFILIYFIISKKLLMIDVAKILKILATRNNIKESDCVLFNWKEVLL